VRITTILDALGMLLLILAASLAVWQWLDSIPAALAVAGGLTLIFSYFIDFVGRHSK
jgi:hypothetical protein